MCGDQNDSTRKSQKRGRQIPSNQPNDQKTSDHTSLFSLAGSYTLEASKMANTSAIPLSLLQMIMLNAVVCGLEFCASAAFTYIPPMLLKSGIAEKHMSMVLGCGPLLGFFLVPVIGRASDRCQSRYGRRRPFIFWLSVLLLCSLFIIPYGELLAVFLLGQTHSSKGIAVALLVIGSVLLDFTSQVTLTPCEALLSDASAVTHQQDRIFTVYSFMVSIGGCVGYLITALDWSNNAVGVYFGSQERAVFSVLMILFSAAMIASLCIVEEKPVCLVDSNQVNQELDQIHKAMVKEKQVENVIFGQDAGYETSSNQSTTDEFGAPTLFHSSKSVDDMTIQENAPMLQRSGSLTEFTLAHSANFLRRIFIFPRSLREGHLRLPFGIVSIARCDSVIQALWIRIQRILPETLRSLLRVPFVLKRLAVTHFFAWSAVMAFNLFFTDFVGQAVYLGNPNADEGSDARNRYDEGVRMGSWGLLFHCITSAIYAAFVERLVQAFGPRTTYFIGMFTFTVSMFIMVLSQSVAVVNLMAACTGFAYATVTTIPFSLVSAYHENKEIYFYDVMPNTGTTQTRGIGSDMATLDSSYFLSQIVLTAIMGYIVYLSGTVMAYIVVAGSLGAVACACTIRIIVDKKQMATLIRGNSVKSGQIEV